MTKLWSNQFCAQMAVTAVLTAAACATAGASVWHVSTAGQITSAVNGAASGDEIIVAAGTYNIGELWMDTPNVTLRGATGNREDVLFVGGGMNADAHPRIGLHVVNDDITVQGLTLSEYRYHAVQVHGENAVDRTRITNVRTLNIGEQHIKGSISSNAPSNWPDGGIIENCLLEQTKPRSGHGDLNYIGGVDIHAPHNWTVRDNVIRDIKGADGYGDAGIFLWNGAVNCTVERNVIVGCANGIAFGNPYGPTHPSAGGYHANGGIIRNNFIVRGPNLALELTRTKDVKVYHNTVFSDDASYGQTVRIYGSETTGLELAHNLIRGGLGDGTGGVGWTSTNDLIDDTGTVVTADWFVDPTGGDLHLTALAAGAIDQCGLLGDVPEDIDGQLRPFGALADAGADEYIPEPSSALLLALCVLGLRRRSRA